MTERTIIIIGAGIAGLATGCYGQMNDYRTQIFELHDKPGGLCTSWNRKGYTFDGCIHWLVGSRAGSSFNGIWQELGAVQGREMVDDRIQHCYDEWPIFQPIIQVSLGVARDLSDQPHMVTYPLEEPITVAGEVRKRLSVKHYCYDPTLAPAGKSVVVVIFESEYAYWENLRGERERYDAEKHEIAIRVMDRLERRFPGITEQVEVVDVTTPMTYERYTGNWQGSMEGWMLTTKTMGATMGRGLDKTLPGLENFFMAGQWVEPGGGVPAAAMSGRQVMQELCKRDGRRFVAETPPA